MFHINGNKQSILLILLSIIVIVIVAVIAVIDVAVVVVVYSQSVLSIRLRDREIVAFNLWNT